MTFRGISLGCGNFGGIGSAPEFFGHGIPDTIETFVRLREEGLIGAWGLSNYDADGLREALESDRPALVQNSYSLLDRSDEEELLPLCEELGIPYVPFGPLAGGWLTGKYRHGEPFPAGSRMTQRPASYQRYVDDRVFDALDLLREEAARRGVDMPTLAFAWVLARVDGAVCGPMRTEHLDAVLVARELELSADDVQRIGALFD